MTVVMDRPIRRSKWLRHRKWVAVAASAVVVVALAIAFLSGAERSVRVAANSVTVDKVEQGVFHDFIPLRGTVVPHDTIYLDAASGGRVERVLVEPGDRVTAGQPLIEFSNTNLQLTVIQQESQLNQAITQLQTNEINLEVNRINNERTLAQLDYSIIRDTRSIKRRDLLAAKGFTAEEQKDIVQDQLDYERTLRPLQADSNRAQEEIRLHPASADRGSASASCRRTF